MTWLIVVGSGVWLVNAELGILAWSRRVDREWLEQQAQPERAAGGVDTLGGEPNHLSPGIATGSPRPLGLGAMRRIRRDG